MSDNHVIIDPDVPVPDPVVPAPKDDLTVDEVKNFAKMILDFLHGVMGFLPPEVQNGVLGKILLVADQLVSKDWFLAVMVRFINYFLAKKGLVNEAEVQGFFASAFQENWIESLEITE